MSFAQDMVKFQKRLQSNATKAHRAIGGHFLAGKAASVSRGPGEHGQDMVYTANDGYGVVGQSTILSGNLVENWVIGVGSVNASWDPSLTAHDASGVVADIKNAIYSSGAGDTLVLSNATPYALSVEFGLPSSRKWQQPDGWVRLQADRFGQATVNEVLRELPV